VAAIIQQGKSPLNFELSDAGELAAMALTWTQDRESRMARSSKPKARRLCALIEPVRTATEMRYGINSRENIQNAHPRAPPSWRSSWARDCATHLSLSLQATVAI
jgi:hypothetical protein